MRALSVAQITKANRSLKTSKQRGNTPISEAIAPAKTTRLDRLSPVQILSTAAAVSLTLHLVSGVSMHYLEKNSRIIHPITPEKIEVAIVEKIEEPLPEIVKITKPTIETTTPPAITPPKPLPVTDAPPPPNEEAAEETPPQEIVAGISPDSTSNESDITVATGNTLYAPPAEVAKTPEEIKPYKAKEYAPFYLVSTAPVYLRNLRDADMIKVYPAEARSLKIEATVSLKLIIDDDGSVTQATVVRDPGNGFAAAAQQLALKMRFTPAKVNGQAVATEFPYNLKFSLK